MHATIYPLANTTAQWYADNYPGATFSYMEKVLWHSTEGSGWPAYSGGAVAPNLTCNPDVANKRLIWRQHYPINMSSRALAHTRTQPTNGDHVVQIELVGTCVSGGPGFYWPGAADWALNGLADFTEWMNGEWGVPFSSTVTWRPPGATGDWQRLSDSAYNSYAGHLGHEHAPQNDHRDVGQLNMNRILALAVSGKTGGQVTPDEINAISDAVVSKILTTNPAGSPLNLQTIWARDFPQQMENTNRLAKLQETVDLLGRAVAAADANDANAPKVDVQELATALAGLLHETPGIDAQAVAKAVADKVAERMAD
jgi:hypothetical protein